MSIDSMIFHIGAERFVEFYFELKTLDYEKCYDFIKENINGDTHDASRIVKLSKYIFDNNMELDVLDAIIQKRMVNDKLKTKAQMIIRANKDV